MERPTNAGPFSDALDGVIVSYVYASHYKPSLLGGKRAWHNDTPLPCHATRWRNFHDGGGDRDLCPVWTTGRSGEWTKTMLELVSELGNQGAGRRVGVGGRFSVVVGRG
jgi:hypothetical protein